MLFGNQQNNQNQFIVEQNKQIEFMIVDLNQEMGPNLIKKIGLHADNEKLFKYN